MTLPANGVMTISSISTLCRGSNTEFGMTNWDARWLAGKDRGVIKLSDFYSKPTPGANTYSTPGTYTFLVPAHESLSVDVRGAGGGGGGGGYWLNAMWVYGWIIALTGNWGTAGGSSSFGGVVAYGGSPGSPGGGLNQGSVGADGGGTGGSVTTGGGSAGGAGGPANRNEGSGYQGYGGNGGDGGKTTKSYTYLASGGLTWKDSITIVVGAGGRGGPTNPGITPAGSPGAAGQVTISWS